ncbi:hypothetical protein D9M71_484740 [compost metagenome]
MTGHAPLTQHPESLQCQGPFANRGKKLAGFGLLRYPLCQRLVHRHVLPPFLAPRQHDQFERLGKQVHQHAVGGQARATGAGKHAPAFDAGHHHFNFGAAQHVDQGHALQVIHAFSNYDQGSVGHDCTPSGYG